MNTHKESRKDKKEMKYVGFGIDRMIHYTKPKTYWRIRLGFFVINTKIKKLK